MPIVDMERVNKFYGISCDEDGDETSIGALTYTQDEIQKTYLVAFKQDTDLPHNGELGKLDFLKARRLVHPNVHKQSHFNIIPLVSNMHGTFDRFRWSIYPTLALLKRYELNEIKHLRYRKHEIDNNRPDPGRLSWDHSYGRENSINDFVTFAIGPDESYTLHDNRYRAQRIVFFTELDRPVLSLIVSPNIVILQRTKMLKPKAGESPEWVRTLFLRTREIGSNIIRCWTTKPKDMDKVAQGKEPFPGPTYRTGPPDPDPEDEARGYDTGPKRKYESPPPNEDDDKSSDYCSILTRSEGPENDSSSQDMLAALYDVSRDGLGYWPRSRPLSVASWIESLTPSEFMDASLSNLPSWNGIPSDDGEMFYDAPGLEDGTKHKDDGNGKREDVEVLPLMHTDVSQVPGDERYYGYGQRH